VGDWLSQVFVNQDFTLSMVNFFTFWEPAYLYTSLWTSNGSFNFRGYASDEYDQTVADAATGRNSRRSHPALSGGQAIIHEDVPDVMLWFRDGARGERPRPWPQHRSLAEQQRTRLRTGVAGPIMHAIEL